MMSLLTIGMLLVSCNDDDTVNVDLTGNLEVSIDGLDNLGSDFQYEGWLLVDGTPITTGVFTVNDAGELSQTRFEVLNAVLDSATKFILTIEPVPDNDPAPSDQKYLAGDFNNDTAVISTSVAPAIGDFSDISGTYFLRTPTDEVPGDANNGNDQNGVWFGLPGMPPMANFDLPTLPVGWIYEGWVIGDSGPISTGTFSDFGDRDSSNMFSGMQFNDGPPVPGEDFFLNAPMGETFPLDIRGRMVVISVEPVPDNSPAPFTLKPLAAMVAADAETAPTAHNFNNNTSLTYPTGMVTR